MSFVAYTYVHNALRGGYPLFESIASYLPYVDYVEVLSCDCDDGTDDYLEEIAKNPRINLHKGPWEAASDTENTLQTAWSHYREFTSSNDVIIHVEADEVFDVSLIRVIAAMVRGGYWDVAYPRVQVEQNFQRLRWNVHWVHRVFLQGTVTRSAHTTQEKERATKILVEDGLCWDCAYCFRDQYFSRREQNMKIWPPFGHRLAPEHVSQSWELTEEQIRQELQEERWEWKYSPFQLPGLLKRLVGQTTYQPSAYLVERMREDDGDILKIINDPGPM